MGQVKDLIILDNIRSVYNVGSIFRTADAAGIDSIYLCGITPTPFDRLGNAREDLHKVALGAEKTIPSRYFSTIEEAIAECTSRTIVAVEQSTKSVLYTDFYNKQPIAYIFGNEVDGVSSKALDLADHVIEIPQIGKKESLNVTIAAGIILFNRLEEKRNKE